MSSSDVTTETGADAPVTHVTAVTQFIDADDVRFAYRRLGAPGARPLGDAPALTRQSRRLGSRAHRRKSPASASSLIEIAERDR